MMRVTRRALYALLTDPATGHSYDLFEIVSATILFGRALAILYIAFVLCLGLGGGR